MNSANQPTRSNQKILIVALENDTSLNIFSQNLQKMDVLALSLAATTEVNIEIRSTEPVVVLAGTDCFYSASDTCSHRAHMVLPSVCDQGKLPFLITDGIGDVPSPSPYK